MLMIINTTFVNKKQPLKSLQTAKIWFINGQ